MKKISPNTINRVLLYLRVLEDLIKDKRYLVSSGDISRFTGVSDVQIRKDISSFGKVGTPRIGYRTIELKKVLKDFILQCDVVRIVLFGVGNLGKAILKYPGFNKDRIKVVAAFDRLGSRINKKINSVIVYPVERAPEVIKRLRADIGIIAVPKKSAQGVADIMVLSGLRGIVNFSPCPINVPKSVMVKDIDLTIEFLSLCCSIKA